MPTITLFFNELCKDIFRVTYTLFKIMIPMLIIIKIFEELGGIVLISQLLGPLMNSVGLPDSMSLVWTTTLITNIYGGLIVLINMDETLTVAQASILGSMMLLAHTLPIEATIAKKAGVSLWATLFLRIGGSLLLAWLLHLSYQYTGTLQHEAVILWKPEVNTDPSYLGWTIKQTFSLFMVFIVISILLFTLKTLKLLGIEKLMAWLLKPFLRLLGISKEATSLTIIGITLGLAFGGGLLIHEAKQGHIKARDVFTAIMLLNLLHSLIEDTLLILLIGADFNTIFWGRLIFSIAVISLLSQVVRRLSPAFCEAYLYKSVVPIKHG
jgi:hypothetical protein